MDTLLTLPALAYFVVPSSLTSYSTSLNLLFFYMTWSTLVLSYTPLKVELIGTLGIRLVFFLVPSIIFLLFDTLLPSLSVNIKLQGTAALPTRTGGTKIARRGATRPQWYQVAGISILNVILGVAIQAGVEVLLTDFLRFRSALRVTTTLPMPWGILKDLGRGIILREVLQYYIHRFILHPSRLNFLSDLHNKYHHTVSAPYSFVTHYDHPITYVLWRFIPTYLPAAIFRVHLLTYLLLLSIVSLEETLALSGYTIIPGIILGGISKRQDLHSETKGDGNFAPIGFLDWLHGTGIGGDVIEDITDEADKHDVAGRSANALNGATEKGKQGLKGFRVRKSSKKS